MEYFYGFTSNPEDVKKVKISSLKELMDLYEKEGELLITDLYNPETDAFEPAILIVDSPY